VIVLNGRYAGRKAVIVENRDDGTKARPYGYAVVAGVDKYPKKITKSMGKKKIAKKTKIAPFVKAINYNHLMPTRYDLSLAVYTGGNYVGNPITHHRAVFTGTVSMLSSGALSARRTLSRRVRTSTRPSRPSRRCSRPGTILPPYFLSLFSSPLLLG
jgi:ribosomal protein L14E/L6E/L27E